MSDSIESHQKEVGRFAPSKEFSAKALIQSHAKYKAMYDRSISDPDSFWAEQAGRLTWMEKWKQVQKWDFHAAKIEWFIGGKLNVAANCLDRHLAKRGEQVAIIWEADDPHAVTLHSLDQ